MNKKKTMMQNLYYKASLLFLSLRYIVIIIYYYFTLFNTITVFSKIIVYKNIGQKCAIIATKYTNITNYFYWRDKFEQVIDRFNN